MFYASAFVYDKVIDSEIRQNPTQTTQLLEFKYFHSLQTRPKAFWSVLSFKLWGISTTLNMAGSVFATFTYSGLAAILYFLAQ